MTRTEKLLIVLSFIGCVTVISIVLKFADKIDAMGEKPTTCEPHLQPACCYCKRCWRCWALIDVNHTRTG